jgi:hypothetical protein
MVQAGSRAYAWRSSGVRSRPAIEGRRGLLDLAREFSISSMEIVADSTVGAGDFASTPGAGKVGERAEGLGCADAAKALSHGLA